MPTCTATDGARGAKETKEVEGERRTVGSGSCDCFGFDLGSIYRVYAYASASPSAPLVSTLMREPDGPVAPSQKRRRPPRSRPCSSTLCV